MLTSGGLHAVSAYVLEPLEDGDLLSLGKLSRLVNQPSPPHHADCSCRWRSNTISEALGRDDPENGYDHDAFRSLACGRDHGEIVQDESA